MARLNEELLFNVVKKVYKDLEPSLDLYAPYDCYSDRYNLYIELKCRRTHYQTLLLERIKYDRLIECARLRNMKPIYICSTPEGVWKFDLSNLKLKWQIEQLPATTDFENTEVISKVVCYLPLQDGVKLPRQYLLNWAV